jgi:hypothetical protein
MSVLLASIELVENKIKNNSKTLNIILKFISIEISQRNMRLKTL